MTACDLKKYIFENGKIEFILTEIGCSHVKYHSNKDYYSASNPDGDNIGAINIYNNEYLNYVNYTRGVSNNDAQDIISLVQAVKNLNFISALRFLHNLLGQPFTYQNKQVNNKPDPLNVFKRHLKSKENKNCSFIPMDERILNDFIPTVHVDFFRQGICKKTIDKFGLEYSYRYKRTIIPVRYHATGELMGYTGRTSIENYDEFGITKYYISPNMNKSINLYGLWENREAIEKAKYVSVFEAEKSVLKRDSLLDGTCVALEGCVASEEQIRLLLGLSVNEIVIQLDKDISEEKVWRICHKLFRIKNVSYVKDKWGLLGEKDSPADANSKTYNFLFKHRIRYTEETDKRYMKLYEKN